MNVWFLTFYTFHRWFLPVMLAASHMCNTAAIQHPICARFGPIKPTRSGPNPIQYQDRFDH